MKLKITGILKLLNHPLNYKLKHVKINKSLFKEVSFQEFKSYLPAI